MDSIAIIFLWKYNVSEIDSHSFLFEINSVKKKTIFSVKNTDFFVTLTLSIFYNI